MCLPWPELDRWETLNDQTFSFSSVSLTGFVARIIGEEGVAASVSAIVGELCCANTGSASGKQVKPDEVDLQSGALVLSRDEKRLRWWCMKSQSFGLVLCRGGLSLRGKALTNEID